jgi:predicted ribosomally synthesized peptide with SipW-like signal peptide
MKNIKKLVLIITVVAMVSSVIALGALSYFSDTETSNGNTFTAARLDLTVDGQNGTNVQKFNVTRMTPGNQPNSGWIVKNIGDISGYFGVSSVIVQNIENDLTEPEIQAGDSSADVGELGDLVNIHLFLDNNKDGWISTGEEVFYNGKISDLPSSFDLDEVIAAGAETRIGAIINWWNNGDLDNKAQSDTATIDITFRLTQRADQ